MQENTKQKEKQIEQLMQKIDKHEKTIKKLHRSLLAKQDGSLEEATVALEEGIPDEFLFELEKHSESSIPSDREQELLEKVKQLEQQIESMNDQQVLEDAVTSLQDEVRRLESKRQELEKEVDIKAEGEVELLSRINELQEELTKAIEAFKEIKQEKEKAEKNLELETESGKDLRREKEALQRHLNESRLQISTLKVCCL